MGSRLLYRGIVCFQHLACRGSFILLLMVYGNEIRFCCVTRTLKMSEWRLNTDHRLRSAARECRSTYFYSCFSPPLGIRLLC